MKMTGTSHFPQRVYGTSRFASQKQISEYLEVVDSALETDGIIIGKNT